MTLDKIREAYYAEPNKNKPLKICHGFPYDQAMTIREKTHVITAKLKEYAENGYGGIVTNVSFHHYLNDEEEWQLFRHILQSCRDMGLRVWLYDEKAYPSGTAGGLTLAEHPEYQAQAVCMKTVTAAPGEEIRIDFPKGHLHVLAAYSYRSDGLETISDNDILNPYKIYDLRNTQNGICEVNESGNALTTVYFLRKYMYEGTHAVHNVAESRRYIDVSNRNAVSAFIENTYKKYAFYTKDCGGAEAIFTDEPSYMGAYINAGLFPSSVLDEFDETMEFLPVVNWGADLENRFMSEYGYDILPCLTCLFTGKTKMARQIRVDFYRMLSKLYEESFFAQISDYCAQINIPFSGHVLLEDDIRYHPVFEGNLFSLLRHMHYPGIDMLNGTPERTRADAFTPKLISSVAHAYGRKHVMSEVSAHAQGGKVTPGQMLGTVTAQYALGVDVFTSYFGDHALPPDKFREWNDTIGRIDKIMGGGKHLCDIAVYYPIETIQANYIPFGEQIYNEINRIRENNACWRSLCDIYNGLLNHQLDFDFLDLYAAGRSDFCGGIMRTAGGEDYRIMILPACYVSEEIEALVSRMNIGGIRVIALFDPEYADDLGRLQKCGAEIFGSMDSMTGMLRYFLKPDLILSDYHPEIVYLCRQNQYGKSILAVNTSDRTIETEASVRNFTDGIVVYDPQNDSVLDRAEPFSVKLKFESYKALMILGDDYTK